MSANRLKLKKDKTQFIWLSTPHHLSKLGCQTTTLGSVVIKVYTEAMCLQVRLGSRPTLTVRRLFRKSFYRLRRLRIVRRSLSKASAKTMVVMVHAGLIAATASCTVSAQFTSGRCRMYSVQRRSSHCAETRSHHCWHSWPSASVASSTEDRLQGVRPSIQMSTSDSTHLSLRVMHPGCSSSQTVSSTFSIARQPRHHVLQDKAIWTKKFRLYRADELYGTDFHWQFVTRRSRYHWLSSVCN